MQICRKVSRGWAKSSGVFNKNLLLDHTPTAAQMQAAIMQQQMAASAMAMQKLASRQARISIAMGGLYSRSCMTMKK